MNELNIPVRTISVDEYVRAGCPDLRRGMIVTVYRPWSWRRPLVSWLADQIRKFESDILGHTATESHVMIYIGRGKFASQDCKFGVADLRDYKGCTLTFWDAPDWPQPPRNNLVAEAMVHVGDSYGYWDVAAQAMRAITGNDVWLQALADSAWICSEAVCTLARRCCDPNYGGEGDCNKVPQRLADWMAANGFKALALRPT